MSSRDFDLSIIVSSYNRENKVRQTIDSVFASDLGIFENIELIVIDDGSPIPVASELPPTSSIPPKISMRLIEQKNAGIGATRNRGFREAQAKVVLFLDDDIILPKDTIKNMYEAEEEHKGAVIFGSYPFISHSSQSLHLFARRLFNYDDITKEKSFERVDAITSGLLCVNKERLGNPANFYRDDMTVPAAEEHDVIVRFKDLGVPIYRACHISATHNHHLELEWLANQQYKYGMATAEAFIKNPRILQMERFAKMKKGMEPRGLKKWVKSILGSSKGKKMLFGYASRLEKRNPDKPHHKIYTLLTAIYFYAGYREGLKRFSPGSQGIPQTSPA
jgi:glycosyltransferase involved in cell wall biosynthesis